ncbi:MFS transporter [Duganella dendranthematis]|jgi:predicted MFS family arabinose efflux permease|uniref:MFS transporter n=1 Tax=Duganella dendranthematis TaxID=2728021 RepID=A0ABX6M542_9BURK|nr:MFS transporter [Duganella dendranthematis]QJD89422.1 MFS transporter [Duganella dendranthematis]
MKTTGLKQRVSTRLAFLAAGMAMSSWAPLVPYAQARTGVEAAQLGLLLLCLGIGSLLAMPVTGILAARFGCRRVILLSGLGCCAVFPFLAIAPSAPLLALALFLFGATIGTLDVSMNVQAVIVEKDYGGALMSGFHGLFSVGGIVGAGSMSAMLWLGMDIVSASVAMTIAVALVLLAAGPNLLREAPAAERDAPLLVVPRGAVVLIGVLCMFVFLAEGAVLDWSAVLLTNGGMSGAQGGLGYAAFAVAMTIGRLNGDRIVQRWGGRRIMLLGGLASALGFLLVVLAPSAWLALPGFVLIGCGASNIVPVLFTAAGSQRDMPASLAVSAISTIGYAGILAGPGVIGFVAHAVGLQWAFAALACGMLVVALSGSSVAPAAGGDARP